MVPPNETQYHKNIKMRGVGFEPTLPFGKQRFASSYIFEI